MESRPAPLQISVVSDVVCPWCYLGKRRLERAAAETGVPVSLAWLPFELNPDMPEGGMERSAYRAAKFGARRSAELDAQMTQLGAEEGAHFSFERISRTPNTRLAHTLIALASQKGLGDAAAEALFRAYFEEARDIGDEDVLVALAQAIGIAEDEARAALGSEDLRRAVAAMAGSAAQGGISGVPFFIIEKKWSVSGAQTSDAWAKVLEGIAAERGPDQERL